MTKRVAIAVDANGVGWFHRLPPEPPPKGCPIVMDDGVTPRYQDWNPQIVGADNDGQQ
jgi:hypothetical protein